MKYILSLVMVLAFAGAGCTQINTSTTTDSEQQNIPLADGGNVTIVAEQETTTKLENGGVPIIDVQLGVSADVSVNMKAENFMFSPNVIRAKAGERITVTFEKSDGMHTFVIDEADVNFAITQGEALTFRAPSEPGEYPYYCALHSSMKGTLIVE